MYLARNNTRPNQATVLTEESILVSATEENKEMLLGLFAEVIPRGSTNFEDVSNPVNSGAGGTSHACMRCFHWPRGRNRCCDGGGPVGSSPNHPTSYQTTIVREEDCHSSAGGVG